MGNTRKRNASHSSYSYSATAVLVIERLPPWQTPDRILHEANKGMLPACPGEAHVRCYTTAVYGKPPPAFPTLHTPPPGFIPVERCLATTRAPLVRPLSTRRTAAKGGGAAGGELRLRVNRSSCQTSALPAQGRQGRQSPQARPQLPATTFCSAHSPRFVSAQENPVRRIVRRRSSEQGTSWGRTLSTRQCHKTKPASATSEYEQNRRCTRHHPGLSRWSDVWQLHGRRNTPPLLPPHRRQRRRCGGRRASAPRQPI